MDTESVVLPLELAGADAVTEGTTSVETTLRSMRREFAHGVEGAKGLGEAFRALAGDGDMTTTALMELSKVPLALSSPVGAATLAIGLLVEAFKTLNTTSEPTKGDLAALHKEVNSGFSAWQDYFKVIVEGGTQAEAELTKLIAEKKTSFALETDSVKAQVVAADDLIAKDEARLQDLKEIEKQGPASWGQLATAAKMAFIEFGNGVPVEMQIHAEMEKLSGEIGNQHARLDALTGMWQVHGTHVALVEHHYQQVKKDMEDVDKLDDQITGKKKGKEDTYLPVDVLGSVEDIKKQGDKASKESEKNTQEIDRQWNGLGNSLKNTFASSMQPMFDDYMTAIDNLVNHHGKATKDIGEALKQSAIDTAKSVGAKAMADGLYMEAKALVDLALGIGGNAQAMAAAGEDAAAGAEMLAVAAALGAAGGAMGGGGAGATASAGSSTAPSQGQGTSPGFTLNVVTIGQLDASQAGDLLQQLDTARAQQGIR